MNKLNISAVIITKNNANVIEDCLKSIVGWVSEIIVVDDFSDDETEEICKRYNVKFVKNRFSSFIEQKRLATSLTRNKWVLQLDADERVSVEMREKITSLSTEDFEKYDCFEFKRLTFFWGKWMKHASLYPDYKPRLFNKEKGDWGGVNPHDKFLTTGVTKKISADILHYQNWDLKKYFDRTILYSKLFAQEIFKNGKRAKWHHYTVRPVYTFLYRYFFRLGFLDGIQGFVVSVMGAIGTFAKYVFLKEMERR